LTATICTLAVVLGVSSASGAQVSAQDTGWLWGDPTPQGNALSDVNFIGQRGYAVGEEGTVLRTDDGGQTWTGVASGTLKNLTRVQEVDPNTIVVGGLCTLRESSDAGASFQRIAVTGSEDRCTNSPDSFWFFNASTGFIEQGDGTILITKDAGQTFEAKTPVPRPGEQRPSAPGDLHFLSPSVGFVLVNGTQGGRIMRTTDGAGSWTQVASSSEPLTDIEFVTPTVAYAVGWRDTLLQSTDEGKTWHALPLEVPPGTPTTFFGIACSDVANCLIATGETPLVHTSDGGMTGSLISASAFKLKSVAFSTGSNAVAVGVGGETVLSSDGGASFATRASHNIEPIELSSTIRVGPSPLDAYIPGHGGRIAATTDGGASWLVLRLPTADPIVDVAFPRGEIGYAVDESGTVFRTTTAGRTWSVESSDPPAPAALVAPGANTVLLVGSGGVRRSTDAGRSFRALSATVVVRRNGKKRSVRLSLFRLLAAALSHGAVVFAYGEDLLRSTDAGVRWTLIPRPLPRHPVEAVSFVSASTGYELSDGLLFFTQDSGRHWRQIASVPTKDVGEGTEISFSSVSDGYVLSNYPGEDGLLPFRTEDGGRTWIPEALHASAVAATGTGDYLNGRGLFYTTTGGLLASRSRLTLSISGPHRTTARRLKRAGNHVRITGHLKPAMGGESVVVAWLQGDSWDYEDVIVGASGGFALTVPEIFGTTDFVAQWNGNGVVSGAGTPAVRLTVTQKRSR
jgi:photosystem II stability/assembly factor-like uncharacterized protein